METAVELRGVSKSFGSTQAVLDLNLTVPAGSLCGVIGPNGAGKTTTIRMIMSILFPDTGKVSVLGYASALEAKERIGYLPEERGLYRKMRVGKFLVYMGHLKGLSDPVATARAREYLARLGLEKSERNRCEELSKGMLQKVQFIAAILHRPDLLILDEPFSGLDPLSAKVLRELLMEEHRRGTTILLSTHVMSHAEELCQRVVMINRGRKVLDDAISSIKRRYLARMLALVPLEDRPTDLSTLRALPEVEAVDPVDDGYKIVLAEGIETREAVPRIAAAVPPARIELSRLSLEDIFLQRVSQEHDTVEQQDPSPIDALRDTAA
jgi:ABC-2 type transport system ATP-binding protein